MPVRELGVGRMKTTRIERQVLWTLDETDDCLNIRAAYARRTRIQSSGAKRKHEIRADYVG